MGTEKFAKEHKKNMAHITNGCCSDHPGMDTYIEIQEEDVQNGKSAKYVTIRSSSQNESFHLHSAAIFRYKTNLSLDMYVLISSSFTQRWNIKQGIKVGILFSYHRTIQELLYFQLGASSSNTKIILRESCVFQNQGITRVSCLYRGGLR